MLYKIKTNPFASIIWLILSCTIHIILFQSKVNSNYLLWQRILYMIIAIGFTFPIHELIHFTLMKIFCKGSVEIKIIKSPIGLPTLGTEARGEFQKWQMVIIYLAPLVILTVLLDILFVFFAEIELIFFIVAVCNSVGCFYDIVETLITLTKKN